MNYCLFLHNYSLKMLQDESRKKRKQNRVRPILHNKEEHSPLADDVVDPPPANHFAEIHPKDDALLKRRLSVSFFYYYQLAFYH